MLLATSNLHQEGGTAPKHRRATRTMPWLLRFLYHLLEPGAAFHPLECVLNYVLPAAFWLADGDWGARLAALVIWNATMQLALFVVLVNVPTFLTGHMSYVDIGWPTGLVLLGANALALGEAPLVHRLAVCVPMLLHGLRMCLGAWFKFYMLPLRRSGDSSPLGFYFLRCFKEDLSRYAYAKDRWVEYLTPAHSAFISCAASRRTSVGSIRRLRKRCRRLHCWQSNRCLQSRSHRILSDFPSSHSWR